MKIPVMEPASGGYLEAIKKYKKLSQITLMSAIYLLDNKRYRLVGTYNYGPFGLLFTTNFTNFIVVEENGRIVTDYDLSKKALTIYHTMYTLWRAETHIRSGLVDFHLNLGDFINDTSDFIYTLAPVMEGRRIEKEVYMEAFNKLFECLNISDESALMYKDLSMKLIEPLEIALNRGDISEEMFFETKSLLLDFVRCSDTRFCALLAISECLFPTRVILEDAKKDSAITSLGYTKTIEKLEEIVTLFEGAVSDSIRGQVLNHGRDDIKEILEITEKRKVAPDFIMDETNESMVTKWALR